MVTMQARAFPRTRREPQKRVLLIPIILVIGGLFLNLVSPYFRFIGTVIALTGSLTVFLVGMVFADLWVSSRRTRKIMKEQKSRMNGQGDKLPEEGYDEDDIASPDPFKESFEETG